MQEAPLSFVNESIDIAQLPEFETIQLIKPHPDYWKVICLNLSILISLSATMLTLVIIFSDDVRPNAVWMIPLYLVVIAGLISIYRLSFKKRGYAFRTHDAIYKSGIIAETTTIIPINRIQHIELNEGLFSRIYKLAGLQIFTAGGATGHLHITGIPADEAKRMRDLLLKKLDLLTPNPKDQINE